MRLGVLTGGGDCPGLNAAIRAIAHRAWMLGDEVYGFREGWAGLLGEGKAFRSRRMKSPASSTSAARSSARRAQPGAQRG